MHKIHNHIHYCYTTIFRWSAACYIIQSQLIEYSHEILDHLMETIPKQVQTVDLISFKPIRIIVNTLW